MGRTATGGARHEAAVAAAADAPPSEGDVSDDEFGRAIWLSSRAGRTAVAAARNETARRANTPSWRQCRASEDATRAGTTADLSASEKRSERGGPAAAVEEGRRGGDVSV